MVNNLDNILLSYISHHLHHLRNYQIGLDEGKKPRQRITHKD